jgi:hypothetical protein
VAIEAKAAYEKGRLLAFEDLYIERQRRIDVLTAVMV